MAALLAHGLALALGAGLIYFIYSVNMSYVALHLGLQLACLGLFLPVIRFPIGRVIYAVVIGLLITLAVLHADNFDTYGRIVRETVDAIFQTSGGEAASYLTSFVSGSFIPTLAIVLAIAFITLAMIKPIKIHPATSLILLIPGVVMVYTVRQLPLLIYDAAQDYGARLQQFSANRAALLADAGELASDYKGDLVLVMGESLARQHLQIYGYPRDTTPYLSSIKNELAVYLDVISPHSHTNESLTRAFTFNQRGSIQSLAENLDLITAANGAGLDTYWLSNQNAMGIWDNAVSVIASEASHVRYHDPGTGFTRRRQVHDNVMIDSLFSILDQPSTNGRLIVVHLMATHFPYCQIVPETFEPRSLQYDKPVMDFRFFGSLLVNLQRRGTDEVVRLFTRLNCYDRAVNYVDAMLETIIERLRASDRPATLLFTADHGENVLLNTAHESRTHDHVHVEIPFLLWRNDHDRKPLSVDTNRKTSLADLAYSIADLLNMPVKDVPHRSIFHRDYQSIPRSTLNQRIGYDIYDPDADNVERARASLYALTKTDYQKVWAHRINSGGAMMEAKELFQGIEMDLVLDQGEFKVFHPPAPDVGLTLPDQLIQDRPHLNYWFDWKNASAANIEAALAELTRLNARHNLKSRVLIEINALDRSPRTLSTAGWQTSYYLPTEQILNCITNCTEAQQKDLAQRLISNYSDNGYTAISFDVNLLPFVETHLLETIIAANIPTYTWATQIIISSETAPTQITSLISTRPWIKSVLVTFPNHFAL